MAWVSHHKAERVPHSPHKRVTQEFLCVSFFCICAWQFLTNDFLFEMFFCYIICHTKSKTALQLSVMPFPAESEGSKLNLNAACLADII